MKKSAQTELKWGLIFMLILLVNLGAVTSGGSVTISNFLMYTLFTVSILSYIYVIVVLVASLVTSFRSLRFSYKLERSSQYRKEQVTATFSTFLGVSFTIFIGVLIFVYNLLLIAFGTSFAVYFVICLVKSNSLRKPVEDKENYKPWIEEKNQRRRINLSHSYMKCKNFFKRDEQAKTKVFYLLPILIISTFTGFFAASMFTNILNEPEIALVPQNFRRDGTTYNIATLNYFTDFEDLEDITFNSMFILKNL